MILVKIEVDYASTNKIRAMSPEELSVLREDCPSLEIPEELGQYWSPGDAYMDLAEVERLTDKHGIKAYIHKVKGLAYLQEISSKAAANTTSITNVSVANHNLFCINEVTWLEDACTQELQRHLDAGWRILAVCPANDARRPDYILGRKKEEV